MSSSSSRIPPPSKTRLLLPPQPATTRPGQAPSINTKDAIARHRHADSSVAQSPSRTPSRLPVSSNSPSASASSLLRMADRNSKDGSMPPPPLRISSKHIGRPELSRPSVTRSAALDAEKRSLQRQTSSSAREARAASLSSPTGSLSSRQRAAPTATHNRTVSTSTSSIPSVPTHRRNASTIISQNAGSAPAPRTLKSTRPRSLYASLCPENGPATQLPQQSKTLKTPRPLSLYASPSPESGPATQLPQQSKTLKTPRPLSMYASSPSGNGPATQVPQPSGTRQARSNTSTTAAPPNFRLNGVKRSNTGLLMNDATLLKPPLSPALADPKRPVFSTLQQHFSPNRNLGPKPATASFLAAPTPSKLPENKLITAETAKLQSELLQLHLLHRNSASVRQQWEDSARQKLGKKFERVAARHSQLVALENEEQTRSNASILKNWADFSTLPLEEMSMVLGEVITGLWNMSEPGGKYSKVVRRFEDWCSEVQTIMTSRDDKTEEGSMQFINGLDGIWMHDRGMLVRQLEGLKEQLDGLGGVPKVDGSSLIQVLDGYTELTQGMLSELGVMKSIEQEVLGREEEWIRQSIADISDGDEDVGGGAWRR